MYVSKSLGTEQYELRLTDPDQVKKMLLGYQQKRLNFNDSATNVNDSQDITFDGSVSNIDDQRNSSPNGRLSNLRASP
jgi:hypothetical protein